MDVVGAREEFRAHLYSDIPVPELAQAFVIGSVRLPLNGLVLSIRARSTLLATLNLNKINPTVPIALLPTDTSITSPTAPFVAVWDYLNAVTCAGEALWTLSILDLLQTWNYAGALGVLSTSTFVTTLVDVLLSAMLRAYPSDGGVTSEQVKQRTSVVPTEAKLSLSEQATAVVGLRTMILALMPIHPEVAKRWMVQAFNGLSPGNRGLYEPGAINMMVVFGPLPPGAERAWSTQDNLHGVIHRLWAQVIDAERFAPVATYEHVTVTGNADRKVVNVDGGLQYINVRNSINEGFYEWTSPSTPGRKYFLRFLRLPKV